MKVMKYRTPTKCQNGHFRYLYWTASFGSIKKQYWGPKQPECICPTFNFGEGFDKCGEDEQFTGLLDKNGKEIYEGDILHTPHYDDKFLYHVVEWSEKYCGWYARNKDERYDHDGSLQLYVYAKYYSECEVVGNIHDELFGNSE